MEEGNRPTTYEDDLELAAALALSNQTPSKLEATQLSRAQLIAKQDQEFAQTLAQDQEKERQRQQQNAASAFNKNNNNNQEPVVNVGKQEAEDDDNDPKEKVIKKASKNLGQLSYVGKDVMREIVSFALQSDDPSQAKKQLTTLKLMSKSSNQFMSDSYFAQELAEQIAHQESISDIDAAFKYNIAPVIADYLEQDSTREGDQKIITAQTLGMDPLTYAALYNSIDVARELLRNKPQTANLAEKTNEEMHAFLLKLAQEFAENKAKERGSSEVEIMYEYDADILMADHLKREFASMSFAIRSNAIKILRLLLKKGYGVDDSDGSTLLEREVESGSELMVRFLLQNGARRANALEIATRKKSTKLIQLLLKYGGGRLIEALETALSEKSQEIVDLLLEHAVQHDNILQFAVISQRKEIVELLLKRGARPHQILEEQGSYLGSHYPDMKELLERYKK